MGHHRHGARLALGLLAVVVAAAAVAQQLGPVYVAHPAAPSGACSPSGQRIQAKAGATVQLWCCNSGTWANCTPAGGLDGTDCAAGEAARGVDASGNATGCWTPAGGAAAPPGAQYWVGAPDAGLSAEKDLSALSTGLVVNTSGTPSAYAGASCTLPQVLTALSASGAATCQQPTNVSGSAASAGTASTASALAADGADCGAGEFAKGVSAAGVAQGCAVPPGTYSLPDATAVVTGGVRLTGDFGGTATSPTVPGLAGKANTSHTHGGGDVTSAVASATALAADPTDCTLPNVALGVNASGTAQCGQPTNVTGNAATATTAGALTSDPSNCTGNNWATGIQASGAADCSQPGFSNLSGSLALAQLTDSGTSGLCLLSGGGAGDPAWTTCPSGGGGAPTTAGYWTKTADATLSNEQDMSALGTGLVVNTTTTGVPTIYGGTSCTNQFPRSLNASGAATCASVSMANDVTGTLGVGNGGTGQASNWTQGGVVYANATTTLASTGTGTSGRQDLWSGGTGAPTWVQGTRGVTMTQDRSTSSSTGASTTDLTWSINANEGQTFTCNLTTTNTATSLMRFAVAGPASMTYVNCRFLYASTSLTTLVGATIQGQWASTCTNCTPSVTASVLTSNLTQVLSCSVTNGSNAGSITIYFADSTNGQTNTLKKGSGCFVTGGG